MACQTGLSVALHAMRVLQVFQAKLLHAIDESCPDPAAFKELRSATNFAMCATKTTAQAISCVMAFLVVLKAPAMVKLRAQGLRQDSPF